MDEMNMTEILEQAKETIGSKGVFGVPYEKNGVTVIPAARVMGGAGGGEGQAPSGTGEGTLGNDGNTLPTGSGGGFGMSGHPSGAFVIKGDQVTWLPAVDVNRLVFGFQLVLIVFFLAIRSIARARSAATPAG